MLKTLGKLVSVLIPGSNGGPLQMAVLCSIIALGISVFVSPKLNEYVIAYNDQKYGIDPMTTASTESDVSVKRYTIRKSVLD